MDFPDVPWTYPLPVEWFYDLSNLVSLFNVKFCMDHLVLFDRINQLNWSRRVTPLKLVQPSGSGDDKLKSKWSWQVVKYKTSLEKYSQSISTLIIVQKIECCQRHCKETEIHGIIGSIRRIEFGKTNRIIEKCLVVILCTKYDCRYRIFLVEFYPTGTVLINRWHWLFFK